MNYANKMKSVKYDRSEKRKYMEKSIENNGSNNRCYNHYYDLECQTYYCCYYRYIIFVTNESFISILIDVIIYWPLNFNMFIIMIITNIVSTIIVIIIVFETIIIIIIITFNIVINFNNIAILFLSITFTFTNTNSESIITNSPIPITSTINISVTFTTTITIPTSFLLF